MINDLAADKIESTAKASLIAEKIRESLSAPYLLEVRSDGNATVPILHHCTATIGVMMFFNHELGPENLLKWADTAMYQAKDAGRNSVRFYDIEQ